jgi:Protein of unknown function (DUF1559)
MTRQRTFLWPAVAVVVALSALSHMAGRADEIDPEPPSPWPRTKDSDRERSANNLKQIGLAFHAFHDVNNAFPAAAITDKNGKALLSWRVALLPFLEEDNLYQQFKLDEPWDSKHNKKLLEKIPKVFAPPIQGKPAKPYTTYYQVFTGPDAPFNPKAVRVGAPLMLGPRMANFTDGLTNTALVVEVGEAVPWTKPDDIKYDARKPRLKLGGLFKEGFHVLHGDGAVRLLGRKWDAGALRALITPSGGEILDLSKLPGPEKK